MKTIGPAHRVDASSQSGTDATVGWPAPSLKSCITTAKGDRYPLMKAVTAPSSSILALVPPKAGCVRANGAAQRPTRIQMPLRSVGSCPTDWRMSRHERSEWSVPPACAATHLRLLALVLATDPSNTRGRRSQSAIPKVRCGNAFQPAARVTGINSRSWVKRRKPSTNSELMAEAK
jgi:hypothetical protein